MRLTMKLTVAFLFVCCLAGLLWEEPVRAGRAVSQPTSNTSPVRARAIVSGPNGISGEVLFLQGPFDANGSAVIVHLNPDRGEPGVTGASGGARIACGVIQLVPEDDDDFNIGR